MTDQEYTNKEFMKNHAKSIPYFIEMFDKFVDGALKDVYWVQQGCSAKLNIIDFMTFLRSEMTSLVALQCHVGVISHDIHLSLNEMLHSSDSENWYLALCLIQESIKN